MDRVVERLQPYHHLVPAAGTTGPCPTEAKAIKCQLVCVCVLACVRACACVYLVLRPTYQQLRSYGDGTSILTLIRNSGEFEIEPTTPGLRV